MKITLRILIPLFSIFFPIYYFLTYPDIYTVFSEIRDLDISVEKQFNNQEYEVIPAFEGFFSFKYANNNSWFRRGTVEDSLVHLKSSEYGSLCIRFVNDNKTFVIRWKDGFYLEEVKGYDFNFLTYFLLNLKKLFFVGIALILFTYFVFFKGKKWENGSKLDIVLFCFSVMSFIFISLFFLIT